jgi:hypothetical protein
LTATNAAGTSSPATSSSVRVPVPLVPQCPAATGKLADRRLGIADRQLTTGRKAQLTCLTSVS